MPNWNSVKRQLKFDKPRYLFIKTHKPKNENTNVLRQKQCIIYIFNGKKHHHNMKHWSELLTLTTFCMTKTYDVILKVFFHVKYVLY